MVPSKDDSSPRATRGERGSQMFTKFAASYNPTNAQLEDEFARKYAMKPVHEYTVRKGNATPQVFATYAEACAYQRAHGGVLTYKVEALA